MPRYLAHILLALAVMSCGRREPGSADSDREIEGYADSKSCEGCHTDIARSYRSVAMAQSFRRPTAADVIEDYSRHNRFTHGPSGFTYEMIETNGRFVQRRSERDAHGRRVRVFEREVTFTIGSGRHARSYLYRA